VELPYTGVSEKNKFSNHPGVRPEAVRERRVFCKPSSGHEFYFALNEKSGDVPLRQGHHISLLAFSDDDSQLGQVAWLYIHELAQSFKFPEVDEFLEKVLDQSSLLSLRNMWPLLPVIPISIVPLVGVTFGLALGGAIMVTAAAGASGYAILRIRRHLFGPSEFERGEKERIEIIRVERDRLEEYVQQAMVKLSQ
jgi:hypothetical protein